MVPQNRHWLAYSLRTSLLLLTLLCCLLAWGSSVVRHRNALRRDLPDNHAFELVTVDEFVKRNPQDATRLATIPWHRRLMGDTPVQQIWAHPYLATYSVEQRQRLVQAFPEADVQEVMPLP
jgi:hypothetical protein